MSETREPGINPLHQEASKEIPVHSAQEGIKRAQEFFQREGFQIAENGMLQAPFSAEQLQKLKTQSDSALEQSGSLMPTENDFYQDVLAGVSLWPQVQEGKIQYLFGRGAGVEIALRGEVAGREKNPVTLPYREHSDFDFYGVDYDVAPDSNADLGGKQIYTPEFISVFGHQEYYSLKSTKAFNGTIPGSLLHERAERVNLGGVNITIPEVELLALDKLLTPESTPRIVGKSTISDAVALGLQYDLDRQKILDYYESLVLEPERGSIQQAVGEGAERYLNRFERQYKNLVSDVMKKEGITSDEAIELINGRVTHFIEHPEEAKEVISESTDAMANSFGVMLGLSGSSENPAPKITADMVIARAITPGFIEAPLWNPLKSEFFNEQGKIIDEEYRDQVKAKYKDVKEPEIRQERGREVLNYFAEIDRVKTRI